MPALKIHWLTAKNISTKCRFSTRQICADTQIRGLLAASRIGGKNLKLKLRPESEHQYNSPWNIAADFKISMRLWAEQIAVMLGEYETDNQTGMDIHAVQKKSMHTRRDTRC